MTDRDLLRRSGHTLAFGETMGTPLVLASEEQVQQYMGLLRRWDITVGQEPLFYPDGTINGIINEKEH